MADKRWKRHERMVAKALGSERIANSGYGSPDMVTSLLSVEHKSTRSFSKRVYNALDQSKRNARVGTIPITVFTDYSGVRLRRTVVLDFDDFMQIINELRTTNPVPAL